MHMKDWVQTIFRLCYGALREKIIGCSRALLLPLWYSISLVENNVKLLL